MNSHSTIGVIALQGELDVARKTEIHASLVVPEGARAILLDLGSVTYADSTALTELLRFKSTADSKNVPVAIVATHPQFVRLVQFAGLNETFKVFDRRGDALSYLGEGK